MAFNGLVTTHVNRDRSPTHSGEEKIYEKHAHAEDGYGQGPVTTGQSLSAK